MSSQSIFAKLQASFYEGLLQPLIVFDSRISPKPFVISFPASPDCSWWSMLRSSTWTSRMIFSIEPRLQRTIVQLPSLQIHFPHLSPKIHRQTSTNRIFLLSISSQYAYPNYPPYHLHHNNNISVMFRRSRKLPTQKTRLGPCKILSLPSHQVQNKDN